MTPTFSDDRTYDAQITDRKVSGVSTPTGEVIDFPTNIRYSAVAIDTLDAVSVTDVAAIRQSPGARAFTSERGDRCWIRVRTGQAPQLIVLDAPRFLEACT